MKEFKCRCSAIGDIMSEAKGNITEKQLAEIKTLQAKAKLTEIQSKKLADLIKKSKAPRQISDGAKTYVDTWVKEQIYGRRKDISSKYLDKGNQLEDASIEFFADNSEYGFLAKNEEYFENDFLTGTPDIILKDEIIDMKNSFDCFTFPLFFNGIPNKGYWWQLQGYMALTGRTKAKLVYTLMTTPADINYGKEDNYDAIEPKYRIKTFEVQRDEEAIAQIETRVNEINTYIKNLIK